MHRIILIVSLGLLSLMSFGQKFERIRVGLFYDNKPSKMVVSASVGYYDVYGDGQIAIELSSSNMIYVEQVNGKVEVRTMNALIGTYNKVVCKPKSASSVINLKPIYPRQHHRLYEGRMEFTPRKGRILVVNDVEMDRYIAGVVQSESGNKHSLEYYKVQSIICRTYALKHWGKFASSGHNLCDRVDSQVYKTKCINDTIRAAVEQTRDIVIVDADINLIAAVFHSNSGGATINSEDVWVGNVPYLRAVQDTFSFDMPHYYWEKSISKSSWLNYFSKYYNVDVKDSVMRDSLLSYCPIDRSKYVFPQDSIVPLKSVRRDFDFKSTWFCLKEEGDTLLVRGKGFGHGVGLSQEGAMKMADMGFDYTQILHHYYQDIHLIKLSVIEFFRED